MSDWTPPTVPEAITRIIEISELTQALLFLYGPCRSWDDEEGYATRLVAALDATTLPHDWDVLRAFVADQQR